MSGLPEENGNFDEKLRAIREMPLTEDDPRFASEEMVECASCKRQNPPNRSSCLYCGNTLASSTVSPNAAKISYQRPEAWEEGFSLVYAGKGGPSDEVYGRAAELLQSEPDILRSMASPGGAVPLIYLRSLHDAGLLAARLAQAGFECAIVGDDLLSSKVPPTRVRSIRLLNDCIELEDFNTGNYAPVSAKARVLLVVGSLIKASTEKTGKRRRKTVKTTNETLAVTDEAVLDIYPPSDVFGFRIRSSGFDFSCLGERMSPFASDNMSELVGTLRAKLPSAILIDKYTAVIERLEHVWPVVERKESSKVSRGTFGGVRVESLTIADNTLQFTKFSRLQRHFI